MSNIDKMTANEQLFTELTPEEGAVVEGGAAIEDGASFLLSAAPRVDMWLYVYKPFQNDPVLRVGGKTIASKWNAKQNAYAFSGLKQAFSFDTTVSVWDKDPGGSVNDDLLLSKKVNASDKGKGWSNITAHGYKLYTRVI